MVVLLLVVVLLEMLIMMMQMLGLNFWRMLYVLDRMSEWMIGLQRIHWALILEGRIDYGRARGGMG
jgi:hypothetical protein